MRKLIAVLLGVVVMGGAAALVRFHPWSEGHVSRADRFAAHEDESGERDGPPDGDYWAIRVGYGGDPAHLHFEPRWLLAAAVQDKQVTSGVPAGLRDYTRAAQSPLTLDPDAFTELGPRPLLDEGYGLNGNAGRTNVIVVDPVDPTIAYLGSDGGGVWKTTNCCSDTTTWAVKTDFPEIASMAIGDITLDPNDHDTLYAGTGDLRYGSYSFGAAGVLKSTDQGETWEILGEDVFNPLYGPSAGGFPQYQSIGKVVVDPNNSANVIVSTKTGVFFSYDAGTDWTGPCYTNDHATGANAQRQDGTALLAVDDGGTTRLYVGIGTRGAPTPVQPDLGNNGANGVYRATMPASGCPAVTDWTLLANGWPAATGNGTAGGTQNGRLELAVAPTDPQTLYAMVSSTNLNAGVLAIYKTNDGGDTWTQTGSDSSFPGGAGGQMWYDAGITVSPTDPDVVFASTVDLFRSTNGGASFTNLTEAYGGGPVHPDNHARAFVGGDPEKLLNGNDGGIYYLDNAMSATSAFNANWTSLNTTLSTIEMYHGDITADFATSANPGATAGFQDNGSASVQFSGDPSADDWHATNGGDGIVSRIEPVLGQWWYTSVYYGQIYVSTNGPFGNQQYIGPNFSGSERASFLTPFDLYRYGDLDTPDSGCDATNGCKHIILGTQRVWESLQGGRPSSSWTAKTGDLTKNNLVLGGDNRSYINQIHYSVSDPTIAIVGTNDGNVQYVFGLGASGSATAADVTDNNQLLPDRPIQDVSTDPQDPLVGYAAVGGFSANTPTTPGHVFRVTCDAGCASFTWEDKSGNLPDIPANAVIANPHIPRQVFAGTDWGLYYTNDITAATPVWQRFEGLPHVMIWSMNIDRGFTTLAVFTRARGAWAWPLPLPAGGEADLAVTIAPPAGAEPGMQMNYTLTVTNNGPSAASNVSLDSPLPAGLTFKSASGDCTGSFPCTFPSLASGESKTVTASACVARDYSGPDPIPLAATASSATPDSSPGNNDASANAPIIPVMFVDGFDCP
jgi:uncharacterized repeat protein (TIGR01451 family)